MPVASVLGYAGVGFLTRCFALSIQKRNIFDNLGSHFLTATAFGTAGYYLSGLEARQEELIARRKEQIVANRSRTAGGEE